MSTPARSSWAWWALCMGVALLPLVVGLVAQFGAVPVGVADPDSWLRLTLVRDWLSGASGWYDHGYASNAPFAPPQSHWTRPLDIILAAISLPQLLFTDLKSALINSGLVLPVLCMAGLVAALLRMQRCVNPARSAPLIAAILLICTPVMSNYFEPGYADHHAPLGMLWCVVLALLLCRGLPQGWASAGLLAAPLTLMLWMSPEAMALIGAVYAWLGLQWWLGHATARPLARLATWVAVLAAAAVLVEYPRSTWFTPLYDAISLRYVLVLALAAASAWVLVCVTPATRLRRGLLVAALALLGIKIILRVDPLFLHGPMALIDPYMRMQFLPRITEARSLLQQHPLFSLALLLHPLVAAGVLVACLLRDDAVIRRAHAALLLFFLLITLGLFFLQLRWFYYCYPIAQLTLATWLGAWFAPNDAANRSFWPSYRVRMLHPTEQMFRRVPLAAALLLVPIALMVAAAPPMNAPRKERHACKDDARRIIQSGWLDTVGGGRSMVVLASGDLGTEVLFFTHHRIIASNYHREAAGNRAIDQLLEATATSTFRRGLAQRQVGLILTCPDAMVTPATVLHQLRRGTRTLAELERLKPKVEGLSKTPPAIFLVKR